jgi:6-pyruvoyltetrahydropterin/6-carboxytetrahydropterin synthase
MQRRGEFRINVTKDYLVFASAHFITFAGHRCESLHGHNYRVGVELEGVLEDDNWYVLDFRVLKRLMKGYCDEIDHKVLLPLSNPRLQVVDHGDTVTVAVEDKPRYLFPRGDCALLPIPNTTVEMLAEYLGGQLRDGLAAAGATNIHALEIEVEENFGQSAVYRESLR